MCFSFKLNNKNLYFDVLTNQNNPQPSKICKSNHTEKNVPNIYRCMYNETRQRTQDLIKIIWFVFAFLWHCDGE